MPTPTPPPQTGVFRWSNPATWPSGRVPTQNDDVLIAAGRTVEVDTQAAAARTVTVEGILRAHRSTASRLTLYGNLIVRQRGILDYGRPTDRVLATASIRWYLTESRYVGGHTMAPVATDVGLWATDDSQVWVHGQYRDTWARLTRTARAGDTEIVVDPNWAVGWQIDDMVVLPPTSLRIVGEDVVRQTERRRIVSISGPGRFRLDTALRFDHLVEETTWTDAWGDPWTERMAGVVANPTSNIRFEAADLNHRPHAMFMDRAKTYVEDLEVIGFSPAPKFVGYQAWNDRVLPFVRYAWHYHRQLDGSRSSYVRRLKIRDGVGDGLNLHRSYGIAVEDLLVLNQARYAVRDAATSHYITADSNIRFEGDDGSGNFAADDCWLDRPLIIGPDGRDDGDRVRPWGNGVWTYQSRNCSVNGMVASALGTGVFWATGAGGFEQPHVFRAESMGNGAGFFSWHNSTTPSTIVDLLAWRNDTGISWGAYGTTYWLYQARLIRNTSVGITNVAAGFGLTGFLVDQSPVGIMVDRYGGTSSTDSVYEDGVVRGVQTNLLVNVTSDTSRLTWAQLARVSWDPVGRILFNAAALLTGSRFRIRDQRGLPRATHFTLYRSNDPTAPAAAVMDTAYNARRVDNDTAGTRPRPPRVRLAAPSDDVVSNGSITLTAETSAASVKFYQAHRLLATVPVTGGRATFSFNMAQHPYRRAYFWAEVEQTGAVNTSRVIRVRRF